MPLPYYSRAATAQFWSEHWGGHSVGELLRIASRSPLTTLIERHLPVGGTALEAGCGLGQYVLLLRDRGYRIVGVDWSQEAVTQGIRAGAPLAVMDLRRLGMRDGAVEAYLSLGVVEHDPEGPDAIVAEAARVLSPGGRILLSVPYWNGARRIAGPVLAWQSRRVRAAGGQFYQFAFTRAELGRLLEARGFTVCAYHPYDPARILRKAIRRATRRGGDGARPAGAPEAMPSSAGSRRALQALLYSGPGRRFFGHMLLVVAIRR